MTSVADAFAHCENIARSHYENFTVGSAFLPKDRRAHVYNLYAYSRTVDDIGEACSRSLTTGAAGLRLKRRREVAS